MQKENRRFSMGYPCPYFSLRQVYLHFMESFIFSSVKCRKYDGVCCLSNIFCETEAALNCTGTVQAVLRLNSQRQKESPP